MPAIVESKPPQFHVLPRAEAVPSSPAGQVTEIDELDFYLASRRDGVRHRVKGQSRVISRGDGTRLLQVTPRNGMTHSRIVTPSTTFDECWRWIATVFAVEAGEHDDRGPTTDDPKVASR